MISFRFNDRNSDDFGILIEESNHRSKAKKNIEFISIPGRTGDLIVCDGSRENLTITLSCHMEFDNNKIYMLDLLDEWLNAEDGYKVLEFNDGMKFNAVFIGELSLPDDSFWYSDFELQFSAYEIE